MRRLRVGLVGLGAVAQVVHIPVLQGLADHFEVVAGCDVSLPHAEAIGGRFAVPRVYGSHEDMLACETLDVVAVLNSDEYHADATIAALQAGHPVLLEKPAALTLSDVDRMIAERDATGQAVMVGYMRRHAAAYAKMRSELAGAGAITHVSVRDIIGPNDYFINQTMRVLAANTPAYLADEKAERARRAIAESLPDASPVQARAFRLLSGLSSHDLSALRGLVGIPQRVVAATVRGEGRFISAMLDYGSFTATFETGMDAVGDFDASIEVFTGARRLRLQYDTPYIRHLPTRLTSLSSDGDELIQFDSRPSYRDPYTNQWLRLHAALTGGESFEETLEDARHDVELAIEIARLL